MKKKKAIMIICGSNNEPPAATQPITGGIAPTNEPGTIANGVFLFSRV